MIFALTVHAILVTSSHNKQYGGTALHCVPDPARQDSWASSAKKIWLLEKKLGRKPATHPNHQKKCSKIFCYQFLGQFLPIIVKIRPQLGNLELGRFLGR
jgi:hypothetical protein